MSMSVAFATFVLSKGKASIKSQPVPVLDVRVKLAVSSTPFPLSLKEAGFMSPINAKKGRPRKTGKNQRMLKRGSEGIASTSQQGLG